MSIKFRCKCGRLLQADEEYTGTKIPCWSCGQNVVVPRVGEEGPAKPAAAPVAKWSADLPPEGVLEPGGAIKFACSCGKHVRTSVSRIGKRVGCPRCRKELVVPTGPRRAVPEEKPAPRKPGLGDLVLDSSLDIEFESEEDLSARPTRPLTRGKEATTKPAVRGPERARAGESPAEKPPRPEESDIYHLKEEPKASRPAPAAAKSPPPEGATAWPEDVEAVSDAVELKDGNAHEVEGPKSSGPAGSAPTAVAAAKPGPSATEPQGTEKCPFCQGALPSGAIVCTKCGRYVRTGALVRVGEEVAEADGVAQEGIRRGNLTHFFNAASPLEAAKAGLMNVLNGVILYVAYALLVAIVFQGLMLFQHYADGNPQALVGSRLGSLLVTVFLWTGLVGCIRDGVFQRFFGIERFFYYAATHFLWFLGGLVLVTPAVAGLAVGWLSISVALAALPGFFLKLTLWILIGILLATAFMVCSYVPMLTVLEGVGPVRALVMTASFAFRHSYKLLILMAVAAGVGGALVAIVRVMFMLAKPLLLMALPPALYETIKVVMGAFLGAAVWGVVTSAAMLYYLSHVGDETRLMKIQAVARGPQANPLWVRIAIPVLLVLSVAMGFWQQNSGVSLAANRDVAALAQTFQRAMQPELPEVVFEACDWVDYEPTEAEDAYRGWKTYSNPAWGFKVSYPRSWRVDYEAFTPREGGEPVSRDVMHPGKLADYGVRVGGEGKPTGGGFKLLGRGDAEIAEVAFRPFEKDEGQGAQRGPFIKRKREAPEDESAEYALVDNYNVCGEYMLTVRVVKMPTDRTIQHQLSVMLDTFVFEVEAKGDE